MFGLLNINKPPGMTSHDVVDAVRRSAGRGVKVGHAGTLDPFASGVLVVCLGGATRLADCVRAMPKGYRAEVRLGAVSATDDPEGPLTQTAGARPASLDAVRQVLARMVGTIRQAPPAHSAVHVDGQRAYELARAGRPVELPARPVTIHSIELLRYGWPDLEIDVSCGSGTYIRSLARDIGSALGVGGYCTRLVRTRIGRFSLERAVSLDALDIGRHLLPPTEALGDMPRVSLDEAGVRAVGLGRRIASPLPVAPRAEVALLDAQGRLVAVATASTDGKELHPARVFVLSD
jgi:tRNA pseudouridine55 synthase